MKKHAANMPNGKVTLLTEVFLEIAKDFGVINSLEYLIKMLKLILKEK
jgi:hypothetical protein